MRRPIIRKPTTFLSRTLPAISRASDFASVPRPAMALFLLASISVLMPESSLKASALAASKGRFFLFDAFEPYPGALFVALYSRFPELLLIGYDAVGYFLVGLSGLPDEAAYLSVPLGEYLLHGLVEEAVQDEEEYEKADYLD